MLIVGGSWRFFVMYRDEGLAGRIDNIEKAIQAIKVNQATQNDSYTVYTYSSGNIAFQNNSGGQRTYTISFVPTNPGQNKVLCQFFLVDPMAVQYMSYGRVSAKDPLTGYFDIFAYRSSDPTWRKMAYVTCLANCEGEITVSYKTIY